VPVKLRLSAVDESLLDSFAKDVAAQATRFDELAKQLISLELAIPGVYAAILKLLSGGHWFSLTKLINYLNII
jgi:hypothetical protein